MTATPPRPPRRLTHRLSAAFVRTAEPGFCCDGHGLNVRVDPSGARQWGQRLVIRGRPRMLGLGGYPLVSLAEARNVAFANRQRTRTGGDPRAEKRHGQGVPTVEEAAAAVLAQQRPGWRNAKHARDWPRSLRAYAFPRIGAMPVSAVTTADVLAILTPIWHDKPETARRVRQRIGAVMKWAVAMGLPPLRGKLFLSSSLERCPSHVPHTVPHKMNGTAWHHRRRLWTHQDCVRRPSPPTVFPVPGGAARDRSASTCPRDLIDLVSMKPAHQPDHGTRRTTAAGEPRRSTEPEPHRSSKHGHPRPEELRCRHPPVMPLLLLLWVGRLRAPSTHGHPLALRRPLKAEPAYRALCNTAVLPDVLDDLALASWKVARMRLRPREWAFDEDPTPQEHLGRARQRMHEGRENTELVAILGTLAVVPRQTAPSPAW